MKIKNIFQSKETKNASWLISGKIIQMLLSLIIGMLTARYLGPKNYGLISYGMACVSFFTSFCTLGINNIIVKEFIDNPNDQGVVLGSTLVLRALSSFFSIIVLNIIIKILDKDDFFTKIIVFLCSIGLFFQIFDTFNYWFQARYQSKITVISTFIAYTITSGYKIILLLLGNSTQWFAFASSLDYIVLGGVLWLFYKKQSGPPLKFSWNKGKNLLKNSYHYILSGMMVVIYGQTDKLMLKQMLGGEDVGYYSIATAICSMWVFILNAIIDSLYPTIMKLCRIDHEEYEKKNKQLYAIVFYISVSASFFFVLFGKYVIQVLYGKEYILAEVPLKIITWYTAFSYLGVARNAWIVCEGKQKYLKYMYFSAAIINIILNYILIPLLGVSGAAIASLITQICTSIILPLFFKEMRKNSILILQAILLKGVLKNKKGDKK